MSRFLIIYFFLSLFTYSANANEISVNEIEAAKYVSINIEIKELNEAGLLLKEATMKLSQALEKSSENIDELSPEQLRLINSLADKVDDITVKLNKSVEELPNAIKRAQAPSSELLKQSLKQVKDETITPITEKLELWLIVTIIGLCLLGVCFFLAFAYCAKHIGKMGLTIKQIADGYRIIPVEQYKNTPNGN